MGQNVRVTHAQLTLLTARNIYIIYIYIYIYIYIKEMVERHAKQHCKEIDQYLQNKDVKLFYYKKIID